MTKLFCLCIKRAGALSSALLGLAMFFSAAPAHALTEAQQDAAIATLQITVASLQSAVINQQTTINTLTTKLQYVTASGHDLTLTGNLHVVSGAGHTNAAPNGLGNVIIGYNELRTGSGAVNDRTGSHCLILGAQNNYTSYGGIVAGLSNAASGNYASVTGGFDNTASGSYAVVTGGKVNTASATCAAVGGGNGNTASATYAAVGGGMGYSANVASAFLPTSTSAASLQSFQSQIDSLQNTVTTQGNVTNLFTLSTDPTRVDGKTNTEVTMTGINLHIVNGLGATNGEPAVPFDTANYIVNGLGNLTIGYNDGDLNLRTGSHNLIIGDLQNYTAFGGLVAGLSNSISAPYASVSGGSGNFASGLCSSISGGDYNRASGGESSITGGFSNTASGDTSSVSGGDYNLANGELASVSGGGRVTGSAPESWAGGSLHSP